MKKELYIKTLIIKDYEEQIIKGEKNIYLYTEEDISNMMEIHKLGGDVTYYMYLAKLN